VPGTLNVTNELSKRETKTLLSINMGQCVLRKRVNTCKEARIHKPLLEYLIISNSKGQQKRALFISKTCTFVYPATSNKREIADKQKMDETNNISGKCHKIYFALPSGNGAGQDPNLPMKNRRKIMLPYKQLRNSNKQA